MGNIGSVFAIITLSIKVSIVLLLLHDVPIDNYSLQARKEGLYLNKNP